MRPLPTTMAATWPYRRSFSLVELLVVVTLIGTLVAVSLSSYLTLQGRAEARALEETANSVGRAVAARARVERDTPLEEIVADSADGVGVAATVAGDTAVFNQGSATITAVFDRDGVVSVTAGGSIDYADIVTADNPVAYWRFAETGGATITDAANGAVGTASAVDLDVSLRPSLGSALVVDDEPGRVTVDAQLNLTGSQMTVEFWADVNSGSRAEWARILGLDGGGADHEVTTGTSGSLALAWRFRPRPGWPSGSDLIDSDANLFVTGATHHYAAVYDDDAGTLTFYRDGVTHSQASTNGPVDITVLDVIGNRGDGDTHSPFGGTLDELAIYDDALSEDQLQARIDAAN